MSTSDDPRESEVSYVKVHFRLQDGSNVQRQFLSNEKLQTVFNFALTLRAGARFAPSAFALASMKPRRKFSTGDMDYTLAELGLVPSVLLLLVPARRDSMIKNIP